MGQRPWCRQGGGSRAGTGGVDRADPIPGTAEKQQTRVPANRVGSEFCLIPPSAARPSSAPQPGNPAVVDALSRSRPTLALSRESPWSVIAESPGRGPRSPPRSSAPPPPWRSWSRCRPHTPRRCCRRTSTTASRTVGADPAGAGRWSPTARWCTASRARARTPRHRSGRRPGPITRCRRGSSRPASTARPGTSRWWRGRRA